MYILSENDNLLETFKLVIQNSPVGDLNNGVLNDVELDENSNSAIFQSTLAQNRDLTGYGNRYIILICKEWTPSSFDTISDISRRIVALNSNGSLLIVKKEYKTEDQLRLQEHIENIVQKWKTDWNGLYDKIRKLGDSLARDEALVKVTKWTSPLPPRVTMLDFDDPTLPQKVQNFFGIQGHLIIKDLITQRTNMFTKPPVLHWTNYPRDSEIQISFKFTFPQGSFPEPAFRELTSICRTIHSWEYEYEWTTGLFLREDLVKITAVRTNLYTLEISGRIDQDEVSEGESDAPMKGVWPYLAKCFKSTLEKLEEYDGLPYQLNLVFIGEIFFHKTSDGATVASRSLDAIQTLGAIQRIGSVRFKANDKIFALDTDNAFPGFEPRTLLDFCYIQSEDSEPKERPSSAPTTSIVFEEASPTHKNSHAGANSALLNIKNRGRRVSFGAIHAIPSGGALATNSSPLKTISPGPGSDEEQMDMESPSRSSILEYVDEMLNKTMDEVLVLE
uniref:Uncharacterized protein n=1 Tax=Acrobeloides nanus TaxID=290746 RepID=A0A914C1Z2_9BILA